jgi:diaminopimelate epimerase
MTLQPFLKAHGTENDFVVLEDPDGVLELDAATVRALADRRAGIGGDGVIRVVRTARAGVDAPADAPAWFMDYRNADGVRVFAACLDRAGLAPAGAFPIWTRAGVRQIEILARPEDAGAEAPAEWQVRVGMGQAGRDGSGRVIGISGRRIDAVDVDMGNPHAVAFLPDDLALADLDLTHRPAVDPEPVGGTNIEFVQQHGERHVAMRVFERGVGETRSCGTGVAAVAVAAADRVGDDLTRPWAVDVPGGRLEVARLRDGSITLTGPARVVATGSVHPLR